MYPSAPEHLIFATNPGQSDGAKLAGCRVGLKMVEASLWFSVEGLLSRRGRRDASIVACFWKNLLVFSLLCGFQSSKSGNA